MILVQGNDPQKVDLPDLGDVIYFRQQKFFSDAQEARSVDLRRALSAGKATVLQRYGNVDKEFVISNSVSTKATTVKDNSKIDLVLEKLAALEKSAAPQGQADGAVVNILLERIAKLEQKLSDLSGPGGNPSLTEAVRQLAEKVETSTKGTAILDRLESILSKSGTSGSGYVEQTPMRPEDVYVPTVSVEDSNTHIKLDVRAVEAPASELDASLAALKKLKNQ